MNRRRTVVVERAKEEKVDYDCKHRCITRTGCTYVCGDEVGDKGILGAIIFLNRRINSTLQLLIAQRRSISFKASTGRIHIMPRFFSGRYSASLLIMDVLAPRDV